MKKIIIIGGGIAGLTAGIYARKSGYQVEIYEKNHIAGGQCIGWNRKGHHIDNCIHWLTGTKKGTSLRHLWEDIGALSSDSVFVENDKFYTAIVGSESITLWRDLEKTRKELLALSPEDESEINKFITHVKYAMSCQIPVEKPMDMMNVIDYIKLGKSMENMPKVMKEYGKISIVDFAERFHNQALRILFRDYMPKEYQASAFIVSYATIASGNGEVPVGGSLAMTNRMIERYKKLGGKLYCNCPVKRISLEGKAASGILLEDGKTVKGDYVICATDTMEMFGKLLGKEYMDKKWKAPYENEESYPLFSGFQAAFSIDKNAYPDIDTVFFDCDPFEINNKTIQRMSVKAYGYEEDFAPQGKTVLQLNIIQYDDDYRYWKSLDRKEYKLKKQELAEVIKDRLVKRFPKLDETIELLDCWTPLTYERYCNSYHGAYMSFATKKDVKAFQVKGTIKGVSNLYIASQWILSPGGLPVAAAAGKFAVQRILKKEKGNDSKLTG